MMSFVLISRTFGMVVTFAIAAVVPIPADTDGPLPPRIFCSDLESGPNAGGERDAGVYVSLYGENFGANRGGGRVLIGGGEAAAYPVWSDRKITFQIGAAGRTGNIVVQTSSGSSNGVPFTVRPGKIYFVARNGDDRKNGSFASPWRTIPHAVQTIRPGDTVYAGDGVAQTEDDGQGWDAAVLLRSAWCGGSDYPRALLASPGASVTIGNPSGGKPGAGLRTTDFSAGGGPCAGNWVFGGLNFRGKGPVSVTGPSSRWRFVGNDITCPTTDGSGGGGACFHTMLATHVQLYANVIHDAGTANASALFHGVYFSTDTNHVDMGWNAIYNIRGCRGVQIHSSPLGSGYPNSGYNQFDIAIHDNIIHDTQCDAIIVDTVDPSKGPIRIYNNVIFRAGIGPKNPENTGGWACIAVPARTEHGDPGSGEIEVDHNTLYACGTFDTPPYTSANAAIIAGGKTVRIRNNIIHQIRSKLHPGGVPYLVVWSTAPNGGRVCSDSDNCSGVRGSNNLFFGSGRPPSNAHIVASLNSDPLFQDLGASNFHLKPASPARRRGIPTAIVVDIDGNTRDPGAIDLGAYQSTEPVVQARK
jgi:hypothetical protein